MILALEPWHLLSVAMRMRESDARELVGCGYDDDIVSRQRWACRTALETLAGVTVADDTGRPLACFGMRQGVTDKVAVAFLVAVDGFARYLRSGVRAWRKLVCIGGWRRIEATVFPERARNAVFLSWLGFEFVERLDGVREDGGDLLAYVMRCSHE